MILASGFRFSAHLLCLLLLEGFTAWSSMREPTQVFRLLEAIYHAFDEIAKRRKVFKVETIGDCYGEQKKAVDICFALAVLI